LQNSRPAVDSSYTPGWLSPYNFQSPRKGSPYLRLPFASAQHGRRPTNPDNWTMDRRYRPLGSGNTEQELARGMYQQESTYLAQAMPIGNGPNNVGNGFFAGGGLLAPIYEGPANRAA
jgi:hypothetical protein